MDQDIDTYLGALSPPPPLPPGEETYHHSAADVQMKSPRLRCSSLPRRNRAAKLSLPFRFPSPQSTSPRSPDVYSATSPSSMHSPMDTDDYLASIPPPQQNPISARSPSLSSLDLDSYVGSITRPPQKSMRASPDDEGYESRSTSLTRRHRRSQNNGDYQVRSSATPSSPIDHDDYLRSLSPPSINDDPAPIRYGDYEQGSSVTPSSPIDHDDYLRSLSPPSINDDPAPIRYPSTPPRTQDDQSYQPAPARPTKRRREDSDQDHRPEDNENHGTFERDRFLPELLGDILSTLKFNAPSTWIAHMSLDTYLALERSRHDVAQLRALYVPLDFTRRVNVLDPRQALRVIDDEQIETYKRQLPLPAHPERLPISTLVHHNGHFFGVMIHVPRKAVYIFGERFNQTYVDMAARTRWKEWEGPQIVDSLLLLHDIPVFQPTAVIGINWEQPEGTECGAECGQTLLITQTNPLAFQADGVPCRPLAPCTHQFRVNMLRTLHATVSAVLLGFCSSPTLTPDEQLTAQNLREEWLVDPTKLHQTLQRPLKALQRAMALCTRCQTDDAARRRGNPSALPHELTSQAKRRPTLRDLRRLYPEFATARLSNAHQCDGDVPDEDPEVDQPDQPEQSEQSEQPDQPDQPDQPEQPEVSMANHRAITLCDASAATYRKFPHPIPTPVPPTRPLAGQRIPFNPKFDAYDEGPSLLSTRLITEDYGVCIHPQIYTFIRPTDIEQSLNPNPFPTEWADFGYRTMPDFAQTFDLTDTPWNPADHLFPVLPSDFQGTAEYPESVPSCPTFSLEEFNDRVAQGHPLLPLVGLWISREPRMYGRVDPELDYLRWQRHEPEVEIQLDCDIDSFVAVGKDLPFRDTITLHSLPMHRRQAPLSVSNHVYVEILLSRSEYDIEHRQPMVDGVARAEWWSKRYPLSQIPHLELGSFPKSGAQLLMFNPRLIHRMMYLPYHATNIPYELKQLFYEELLYPAIRHVKPASQHQYWVYSEVMLTHKTGKSSSSLPLDVTAEEFTVMCNFMRKKIANDHSDRLNRFGSFFFVYTVKGTKGLTKHAHEPGITLSTVISRAYHSFCRHFNALDYDRATIKNGVETFFDLGFTFTGVHASTPLTGLWKLDFLEAAFSASGYHAGTAHHLNTFDRYGGLQAEMKEEHRRQSHVASSTAYGLHYQMWRTRDNKVASFTDAQVADYNQDYQGYVARLRHGLRETETNEVNYGVRREFRIGIEALDALMQLEEEDDFDPVERIRSSVTWVPSAIYSRFLHNRLNALDQVVQQLSAFRPRLPNHVTLSGLLSYLLQSIMSTPVMVHKFVRQALRDLYFGATVARYGMFFLHDLDLLNLCSLGLQICDTEEDSYETIRDADVTLGSLAPKRPYSGQRDSETIEMPWKEIDSTLKSTPGKIVAPWQFPSSLKPYIEPPGPDNAIERLAAQLFIQFTQTWWSLCGDFNKHIGREELSVETFEQAVEFWSLSKLWDALKLVDVRVLQKDQDVAFPNRIHLWFRPVQDTGKLSGKWGWFLGTYITSYRQAVAHLNTVPWEGTAASLMLHPDVHRLDNALRHILSLIQCLPDANARAPCQSDPHTGAIQLILNPSALMVSGRAGGRGARTAPPATNKRDEFFLNVHKAGVPIADMKTRLQALRQYKRKTQQYAAHQKGGKQWKRGRGGRRGRVGRPRGGKVVPQVDAEPEDEGVQSSGGSEDSEDLLKEDIDDDTPDEQSDGNEEDAMYD